MKGRKPKPPHLKLVEDNPGKRPISGHAPQPSGDLKTPPRWFTPDQKRAWRVALTSAPAGLLKKLDLSVMVTWTVAADLHRQATEKLNQGALLIKTPNGMPVQSPYLGIINKQAAIMIKAAAEMGFTPSSRSRVELNPDPEDVDEFFGD